MQPFFHLFGLSIPAYGVMMSAGMLLALALLYYTKRFSTFTEDDILTAALYAILLGLVGAKLLYWITELKNIIADPSIFADMLTQGFVFYGSLIGGIAGVLLYVRKHKKNFFALTDLFVPSLALAQAVGRVGCHLAGCCYGCETNGALHVIFPEGSGAPAGVPLVPTQLLESAFLLLLAVLLVYLVTRKKPSGTVLAWYCILYGVWRFFIEFYRNDDRGFVGSLSTSQFIGVFVIAAGVAILVLIRKGVIVSRETNIKTPDAAAESKEPPQDSPKA